MCSFPATSDRSWWIAPTYLGLIIGSGILGFADDARRPRGSANASCSTLRSDVFRHVQGLSLGIFERRRLGDVLSRVTGDVDAVETFLLSGVADALDQTRIRLGVFLGLLFYLQWDLTLLALVIVPLFWGAARRFSRLIKEALPERRRRSGSISAIAEESLGNVALVQAYNRQRWEERRFERENVGRFRADHGLDAEPRRLRIRRRGHRGVRRPRGHGPGHLEAGPGTAHAGRTAGLPGADRQPLQLRVRGLSHLGTTFYAASASAERIIELLDQRPQVVEAAGARRIGRARGDMEFDGVSFRYPGNTVLGTVGRVVPRGSRRADAARAGRGQRGRQVDGREAAAAASTTPTGARSALDGTDLRDLRLSDLPESVAVVLQETLVFHGTVRDNIAYGRPEATQADIVAAARAADAHEFIELLPEGYDTMVGQRGRTLSGRQRQRLAIARAMIKGTRPCSSSTNRPPASMCGPADGSWTRCAGSWPGGRPSSSPTTC
ncbi:ABC transporter ATP-binding protein [Streptomyces hirsutus]